MPLKDDKRQKNQLQQSLAFPETGRGEAPARSRRGTESSVAKRKSESPASTDQLMEEICQAENCKQALARVKSNKGSPGIDGMTVEKLPDYLKQHWPKRQASAETDSTLSPGRSDGERVGESGG